MPPSRAPITAGLALGLTVFAAGLASLIQSNTLATPQGADAPAYVRIAKTLLATGGLELPGPAEIGTAPQMRTGDVYGSPWAMTVNGRLFPKHPFVFGAALVPGVAIGGVPGARLTALLLGGLLAAVATTAAATRFGFVPAVLAGAAAFLLSPGARHVLWGINVDTAIALVWLSALLLADRGRFAAAGFLGGLLLFLRPTALILLASLVALLPGRPRRDLLLFASGFVPLLLVLASLNTAWWGAPWRSPYDRVAVLSEAGLSVGTHSGTFHGNLRTGLGILFLDPSGGLVATAPVAIVGLAGLAFCRRGDRLPMAAAAAGLASFLVLAPYEFLRIAPETAYRFSTPLIAAAVLPLSALLAAARPGMRGRSGPGADPCQ